METGARRGFEVKVPEPSIVWIELNRPDRLNSMSPGVKRDLAEVLVQAQMDDAVRVVVFTGSGNVFSAGDDIGGDEPQEEASRAAAPDLPQGSAQPMATYAALRMISQRLTLAVRELDKLSIAAISGYAIQSGLSLALACDFRIASSDAKLGSATIRFGLLPDEGGHYLLVQHLGVAGAMDFLMRKKIVSAPEALKLGLVHQVVEPEELQNQAMALARELAEGPQAAMRMLKRCIYNAAELSFSQSLEDIATKTAVTDYHPDALEGVSSFRQKRVPQFNQPFDYSRLRDLIQESKEPRES